MVAPRQLERLFDLRTVRRNIRGGLITKERYEEWLKTLPDAADNVATVSFEDEDREARRASPRFPVISPTRPLVSAPFDDDDDDDDYDDEDEDVDGDEAASEADEADEADEAASEPASEAASEPASEPAGEPEAPAGDSNDAGDAGDEG
ncbi:hypothetical protein OV203_10040 [Nannocystis sp. ILAH1]|uniref:hypothetical protein n=1 Tax=unclassified Nannocystis TaxID=2627009 RepID=UPI002270C560|nr:MULTISPECIES: hypothetical protein [unclassified Nannocystis]MCY0987464.1 hypothetical protein [Nannocystis sp. ILAH1]MCY1070741.1 hypothetical protein [Nannocystis sp. RBIL2]